MNAEAYQPFRINGNSQTRIRPNGHKKTTPVMSGRGLEERLIGFEPTTITLAT
ncbi:hypothetical protein RBWH47_02702 [Rhodopirellula baltica WH47]|uniref:Uncharacterized protein n=1 Tax=Rhodopirellula baltica WH47 TaxID=991778 RepID=F2B1K0_RHOBT|nr:hypothetical protein RBWH47_02702 [Rhodopirellula baltica WH47]|tara:strand:- start:16548 stop:16706 length:159 start_codon:yes stop_codon:yes gene_type:complete